MRAIVAASVSKIGVDVNPYAGTIGTTLSQSQDTPLSAFREAILADHQ